MRRKGFLFFLFVILILLNLMMVSAAFTDNGSIQQTLYDCGNLTTARAIYTLNQSLSTGTTCLRIKANYITIDLNGYSITGDDSGTDYGVYNWYYNHTIIKNGGIYDFETGIYLLLNSNNTIKNNSVNSNTEYGIFVYASSVNNTVQNNIISSNTRHGMYLAYNSNNTIENNTISSNIREGMYLYSSANNTVQNNTISSNARYGIKLSSSSDNIFSTNSLNKNFYIFDGESEYVDNNFVSNQFLDNLNTLSSFETDSQEGVAGSRIDFNFTMNYPNGSSCPSCSYQLNLYPSETNLENSSDGALVIGNFTPTRAGIYSLRFNITDENNNSEVRKYLYMINTTSSDLINYHFRNRTATHGQPTNYGGPNDAGSLLLEKPPSPENRSCGNYVVFSMDELPNYLFGIYKQINYSMWYKTDAITTNYTGIERYDKQDSTVDYNVYVSATSTTFEAFNFTVDLMNDYFWVWYWMAIKLVGDNPYVYSNETDPSYANITYVYSNTPAIREITNEDIDLLSATMQDNLSDSANISLYGIGDTNISILMPDTTKDYGVSYDGVDCSSNSNCTLNSLSNGEVNLTLTLGSEHVLEITDITNPKITISSPINTTYETTTTNFNVTLDEAGNCLYSLDAVNYSMSNDSTTNWFAYNATMLEVDNNVTFHCNDSVGNTNSTPILLFYIKNPNEGDTTTSPSGGGGGDDTAGARSDVNVDSSGIVGIEVVKGGVDFGSITISNPSPNAIEVKVSSSDSRIVEVLDKNFMLRSAESRKVRIRINAPGVAGVYEVNINVLAGGIGSVIPVTIVVGSEKASVIADDVITGGVVAEGGRILSLLEKGKQLLSELKSKGKSIGLVSGIIIAGVISIWLVRYTKNVKHRKRKLRRK